MFFHTITHLYREIVQDLEIICKSFGVFATGPYKEAIRIKFMIEPVPFARVYIEALDQEEKTIQTVELLNKVYNGSTHLKVIEADYIREALVDEMLEFYKLLQNCAKSTNEQLKNIFFLQIIDELDSSSVFTAFKRQLIKKHSNLTKIFGESFNTPSKEFNASWKKKDSY